MIRSVESVGFGRPATEALGRAIARGKASGPLAPVTVVVASNVVGLSVRRLLSSGHLGGSGLANVSFLTPLQLVELLAPPPPPHMLPLTNPVLGAVVRQVLAADPGPFTEVAEHPATEAAVATLYSELIHVSPATLDAVGRTGGIAAVSVRLVRAIAARLQHFYGEADLAAAVAERPDLPAEAEQLGHLVWHLPEPVTPSLERALRRVIHEVDTSVVVGLTGVASADEAVLVLCNRVGVEIGAVGVDAPVAHRVVSAPDPDDEVRVAVRTVLELGEEGVPFDRIGIFYPAPDPYVRCLEQHLAEAGVPANGPSRDRLADSVAGRTLLRALALPDQHWRRDQVIALAGGAPVRHGRALARPTTWDAVSRRAGVVQGLDDWRRKLAGHRAALVARAAGLDGPDAERASRVHRDIADLDELGGFVDALAQGVQTVVTARAWADKCSAAQALLAQLLGPEPRHHIWPEPEQDAASRVTDALARLAALDELDPRPTHAVFVRALAQELEAGRGRRGRFGDGVLHGPLVGAPGQDLDAVILLGLAEGLSPSMRREDSLLPDAARAAAVPGELALRSRRLDDQHRAHLAALAAAPPERRVLVHPRGTLRGRTPLLPSRWLLDAISARAGRRIDSSEFGRLGPPLLEVIGSHAEGIRLAPVPLSLTERDLGQLSELAGTGRDPLDHPAGAEASRGIVASSARRSPEFTAWDGHLAAVDIPSPTGTGAPLSPTGLQEWATCGFRYFLSHVLHLRDRDDPERIRELSALDRGSGVHAILERFLLEVLADAAPDPDTPWSDARRQRLQEIAADVFDELERTGRTGRPVTWRIERARLARMLDEFLTHDEARRAAWRTRPVRVELPFGLDDVDPVVVGLPDGRTVRFRGMADRVDRTDDGRWVILDYKTGSGKLYESLADDPFSAGATLQLALYAEAARQRLGGDAAAAYYWMVDQGAGFEVHGYEWTPELRARFVDLLTAMVDGIEAGVFPLVPGEWNHFRNTHDNCAFCPYDRVCPSARGSQAAAKVDAPAMAVRRRLVPPTATDDTATDDTATDDTATNDEVGP